MLIEWSESSRNDLIEAINWFIEQDDAQTGQSIVARIFSVTDRLKKFPNSGRQGLIPGTRELVVPGVPYFLVYQVSQKVEILRVMHTSRLWL